MMALLYKTVPVEETWIECLRDLGRSRIAIEDEDIRDREVWTSIARRWYSKASNKAPTTGFFRVIRYILNGRSRLACQGGALNKYDKIN
jgi:hypothetical protein